MKQNSSSYQTFRELRCCVIVATYNNQNSLAKLLDELLEYTSDIIVVNDGSTDDTENILQRYRQLTLISYSTNKGKGYALRTAFRKALEMGFDYGISIDSDGQHMPANLPVFLEKIREAPGSLIIGARNMKQEAVPSKSSFGNKFSNFWFRFETGIKLPDTQSGFRLYPLLRMKKMLFFTRRFEFEIEVIVRCAWKGIPVLSVPVDVYYPPAKDRVTHFRPFTDFFRISLLNTALVIIALLIVKPFRFARSLNRKNIKNFFLTQFVHNKDSDRKITFSVMLGLFMGIIPIWGWQMAAALLLAVIFKLNKVITLVVSNISIPPMIPLIIYLSYLFGGIAYHSQSVDIAYSSALSLESISVNLVQYIIGSFIFAAVLSLGGGLITFTLLKIFRKKRTAVAIAENQPDQP